MAKLAVTMFPANNGDCFLISFGERPRRHILIDCGYTETYTRFLKKKLNTIAEQNEHLSLFVITHVDQDHLLGAKQFLIDNNKKSFIGISEIWHNSYRHLQFSKEKTEEIGRFEQKILEEEIALGNSFISGIEQGVTETDVGVKQGSTLASLIYKGGYNWNSSFSGKCVSIHVNQFVKIEEICIWILSPNQEKLQNLSREWLAHLKSNKYNFKLSENEIFDDAFEFHMLRKSEARPVDEDVSSKPKSGINNDLFLDEKEINVIDTAPLNGSSIALLIEYGGKTLLFLADAHPDLIISSIKDLKKQGICNTDYFDLIKLPHHGSAKNVTLELAKLLKADKYLISTNGRKHNHPDFQAMSRMILAQEQNPYKEFIFNYPTETAKLLQNEKWIAKYRYAVTIGDGTKPLVIDL